MWAARIRLFFLISFGVLTPLCAYGQSRDTKLNVAIFAYLPDASTAIKKLENAFERRYLSIDLDLELWNPYDDSFEGNGLSRIVDLDIVEIDTCRIDELMEGQFGGIDEIPIEVRRTPDSYVGPAGIISKTEIGTQVVPHWVCGNYLQIWASNKDVVEAKTFESFLKAVDPSAGKPVLAAMWGSTTLGEYYADAVLDIHGPEWAREHLISLWKDGVELDEPAKAAVLSLIKELSKENQANLAHYNDHSYVLPRLFANSRGSTLIGYSERIYYAERELQLTPGQFPPIVKPDEIVIRQFSFADKSQGTPCWTDAFIIPKGRLSKKRAAIAAFLQFIQTNAAYSVFAEPAQFYAASYLLPATAEAYQTDSTIVKKQPLLPQFRDAMTDSFPVSNSKIWRGMRVAGDKLKKAIKP